MSDWRFAILCIVIGASVTFTIMIPTIYSIHSTSSYSEIIADTSGYGGQTEIRWCAPVFEDDGNKVRGWKSISTPVTITEGEYQDNVKDSDIPHAPVAFCESSIFQLISYIPQTTVDSIKNTIAYLESSTFHDYNDYQTVMTIKAFCAGITYKTDEKTYGHEYWQTPIETMYLGFGDCEDMAILFCAIGSKMGLDVALLFTEGHVLAGVVLDGEYGDAVGKWTMVECTYSSQTPYLMNESVPPEITHIADGCPDYIGYYMTYLNKFGKVIGLR